MIERGLREERSFWWKEKEREKRHRGGERESEDKRRRKEETQGLPCATSDRHREEGKRAGRIREGLCDRGITRGTGEAHGNKGTKGGTGSRVTPAGNDQRGKETLETVPP